MTTIPLSTFLPLVTVSLLLLGAIMLFAHQLRRFFGLTPLLMLMGGLTGVLELSLVGFFQVHFGSQSMLLQANSFLIMPILLMGLLIVYALEGTTQTRSVLLGVLVINFFSSIINLISSLNQSLTPVLVDTTIFAAWLRQLAASTLALTLDMIFAVITYQGISNLVRHQPSFLAILAAFLVALWSDAVVYAGIFYSGQPGAWILLQMHILGKTYAGLILTPLLGLYIRYYARNFPGSPFATPRRTLDIFTTSIQLEERARYHHNLLQTLLKINHLVVRATNIQTLLDQACQLLAGNREYLLVGIHLTGRQTVTATAGTNPELFELCMGDATGQSLDESPASTVLNSQTAVIINHMRKVSEDNFWAKKALQRGIGSMACFPLLHEQRTLGAMIVAASQELAFDAEEVKLLGELVDDLANAITNFMLRQEQATLITAAETMPDGLLITDLSGVILYANSVVAEDLHVPGSELIGQSVTRFLPFANRQQLVDGYVQTLVRTGSLELEHELETPDGSKYPLAIRASIVYDPQHHPRQIVISIRDISSYKQYEHQLLALNRLITDMVQHRTKEELLQKVFSAAEELFGMHSSAIYLVDPQGRISEFITHRLSEAYAQRISLDYRGLPGEAVFQTHKPVYINDVLNDPVYQERIHFMAEYGLRALLLLPILYEDHINGVLVIYHDRIHEFTDQDVQLGMTLAHTVAIALQNLYLYQAEHSQRQLAEALADAAANLNRLLNPDQVFDQILEQIVQITSCRSANIMRIQGSNVSLDRRTGYDEAPIHPTEYENFSLPITAPTLKVMYETGEPLLISDTLHDVRWSHVERTDWIRSYAGVPLVVSGQIVGFLNVDSDQPNAFNEDTVRRLQALASQASIAIHNAELYYESNRQAQELSALVQSAATVSSSLDFHQILNLLSEQMVRLVNVEACAISVYDPNSFTVSLLAYHIKPPIQQLDSWKAPFSLIGYPATRRVIEERAIIQVQSEDPQADPSEVALMQEAGVKTLLMLPLVVREETLGLVEIESVEPGRIFTEREIALLQTLGVYAANAIQNARLYTQLQEYAGLLERRVEERTNELRSAKEHIESILASIPDALFVLDDTYQPIRTNQTGEELILHALSEQINLFEPGLLDRLHHGHLSPEEAVLRVNGRSYQPLASPFPVQPGQEGLVIVFRDVTRFRELDEIKTHFVSDVSHELRTPLTNLMLYLDLLASLDDPLKGSGYIKTLQRETKRLGFLIEDLLTISRLEAGRMNITIKPVNVNALIAELVCDRTMLASSHKLTLTFTPDDSIPPALTDASLLNQAISNLLTNSINYTPAGGNIMLTTHLLQDAGEWWVTIDVQDNGVGISEEELSRIFERFYRGSASRETGAPGTGLGLAIAQEIATRVNGKLSVKSLPGSGSTFTFWLKAVL